MSRTRSYYQSPVIIKRQERIRRHAGRYLSHAIDLRNNVHFSEEDYEFAYKQRGEIRYLLDTNVVRFFLNPFEEYRKVAFFDRSSVETLQALAVVTAEFLLSRMLCGQWGAAPMISSWHAHELDSHAAALDAQTRELFDTRHLDVDDDNQLDKMVTELISDLRSLSQLRVSIDHDFRPLGGLGDRMMNPAFVARQFVRVMRDNLISPLRIDKLATSQVLSVPEAEESDLCSWIAYHKNALRLPEDKTSKNSAMDAKTVVQLLRLNEAAAKQASLQPVRYVLITADQALYNATIDWLSNEAKDRIDFFPLRRIGQYIPWLNVNEMPNNAENVDIFNEIRDALDVFLSTVGGGKDRFPRPLPAWVQSPTEEEGDSPFREPMMALAERMSKRATSDPLYLETLEQLAEFWARLNRESIVLNANLLSRRINAFTNLSVFLEDADDVRSAVLKIMEDTVASVERAHVKFSVQHHLAAVIDELLTRDHEVSIRRGMAVLVIRFEEFIGNKPLIPVLNQLVKKPDNLSLAQLLERVGASETYRAFFFSACVAFWASKWESAQFFSKRALERFAYNPEDPRKVREHADLRYFHVVVERYAAMDADVTPSERVNNLKDTLGTLDELAEFDGENQDVFIRCRVCLEAGLVHTTLAYAAQVAGTDTHRSKANAYAEKALKFMGQAIRLMNDAVSDIARDVELQLKSEILIGLTGCILYKEFFEASREPSVFEEWRPLREHVRLMVTEAGDILPDLYTLAPDLLEMVFEKDPMMRLERRLKIITRMQSFKSPAADRTRLDIEVIPLLISRLKAETPQYAIKTRDGDGRAIH